MKGAGSGLVDIGGDAPALLAELANGDRFDLADQRGRIVVVNFWATWCAPCRAEAPTLTRIHNRLAERGGTVLGISADRMDLARVADHALRLGMEYPIGRTDEATFDRFGVTQLPTTFVVSRDGEITWSRVGAVTEERLADAIAELQ
jgi:thiol-disulfide isomerase/thioredoxin